VSIKLNEDFTVSLLVHDQNGQNVDNDTPFAVIQNLSDNKYWNGIAWQDNQFNITLNYAFDGIYNYTFKPDITGQISIKCTSVNYGIANSQIIFVDDIGFSEYAWKLGQQYVISVRTISNIESGRVKLYRSSDSSYYNGSVWSQSLVWINMELTFDKLLQYSFTPDVLCAYCIEIQTSENQKSNYVINVLDNVEGNVPILIDSRTFMSNDGTDSKITDPAGNPLYNAQIMCYDIDNQKQLVAKSISDSAGNWNMSIREGFYYFIFEKDGYLYKTVISALFWLSTPLMKYSVFSEPIIYLSSVGNFIPFFLINLSIIYL